MMSKNKPQILSKKLIIHIPDYHFQNVRYYGFYSNTAQKKLDHIHELPKKKKKKDYSRKKRMKIRNRKMNKLKYRTHLFDSFNRDPLKCKCGYYLRYTYTYDPLEGRKNDRFYRRECINDMQKMQIRGRRPVWVLEELCDKTKEGYVMDCLSCGKKMIQKDIRNVLAK